MEGSDNKDLDNQGTTVLSKYAGWFFVDGYLSPYFLL